MHRTDQHECDVRGEAWTDPLYSFLPVLVTYHPDSSLRAQFLMSCSPDLTPKETGVGK